MKSILHSHKEFVEDYKNIENLDEKFYEAEDVISDCLGCQNYIYYNLNPKEKWDLYTNGILKIFNRGEFNKFN